jgi:hypothetical protein
LARICNYIIGNIVRFSKELYVNSSLFYEGMMHSLFSLMAGHKLRVFKTRYSRKYFDLMRIKQVRNLDHYLKKNLDIYTGNMLLFRW